MLQVDATHLIKKLQKMDSKSSGKLMRTVARKANNLHILKPMKTLAPKRTGLLRRSIKTLALPRKKGVVGSAVGVKRTAPYANPLEHGWRHNRSGRKIKGRFFKRTTYRRSGQAALNFAVQELSGGLI